MCAPAYHTHEKRRLKVTVDLLLSRFVFGIGKNSWAEDSYLNSTWSFSTSNAPGSTCSESTSANPNKHHDNTQERNAARSVQVR
jgi:hypothetical protein